MTSAPVAERARPTAGGPPPTTGPGGARHGWPALVRLALRRDRFRLVVWVLGIALLVLSSAASVLGLYDTPESRASYAALADDNPAVVIQAGPGYGLDQDPTTGAILMNEVAIWTIIAVAVLSTFTTTRHTRAEEDSERAELVRALPVGREAPAVATLVAVLVADTAVALAVALGLVAVGLPLAGAVAFGAALIGVGMVFAALTLVAAQVASSARAATGLGLVAVIAAFILRAVGDVGPHALSWLSPIGWAQAVRAYADERWWALLLPVIATAALLVLASALYERRDYGGGLLKPRLGAAEAPRSLGSPLGLSVRLQRATVLAWAVGIAVLGAFYGVVTDQAEQMLADNPDLADFFAQLGTAPITDAFLSTAVLVVGLLGAGYAVSAVLRLHTEEGAGRVDPLLATPTSRTAWAGSHLLAVLGGLLLVMLAGGLATGLGAAIAMGEPERVGQLVAAGLVMAAGPAVLGAVAALVWAVAPRWSLVAWVGVAVAAVIGMLADLLDLPDAVRALSPLHHVPAMPAEPFEAWPVVALWGVAAALVAAALTALARRDISRS